jgi:hypothetical protein
MHIPSRPTRLWPHWQLVHILDAANGQTICSLDGHTDYISCIQYTTIAASTGCFDEHLIVTCSMDDTVRIWSADTHACLRLLKGHTDSVQCAAVDGNMCVCSAHCRHTPITCYVQTCHRQLGSYGARVELDDGEMRTHTQGSFRLCVLCRVRRAQWPHRERQS